MSSFAYRLFSEPNEFQLRLRALGFYEEAFLTYITRVSRGMEKTKAFEMLVAGRNLTEEERSFVLDVTNKLPI